MSVLSNVSPRYVGSEQKGRVSLLWLTFRSLLASLLLRWKTANTAFVILSFNFQVWRYTPTVAISLLRDLGAGVEQPFDCLIVQNGQAMQSMGRSMDWSLEDNMVDGLYFCATRTGRRSVHTPFVQARAETSSTGLEAGPTVRRPDPRCSWKRNSRGVVAGVGGESAESCRVGLVQPFRIPSVIRQVCLMYAIIAVEMMSCCAARTNGCFNLRRRAFALGEHERWVDCGAGVHTSWHSVLETVWLLCGESQHACEDVRGVDVEEKGCLSGSL